MCQVESTERFSRIRRKRLSCFNCTLSGTWNRPSLPSHSRMGSKWNMFNVLWALAAAKEGIKNSSTFVCLSNPVKEVWYEAQLRVKWKQWNQNSDRRSTKKFSKVTPTCKNEWRWNWILSKFKKIFISKMKRVKMKLELAASPPVEQLMCERE